MTTYRGRTSRGIRPHTLADYRRALGLDDAGDFLTDERGQLVGAVAKFGKRHLDTISPQDVKAYAKELADRGLAPASVRKMLAPVKALFATAFEEGVIRVNPAAGVRIAQPDAMVSEDGEAKAKALDEEQLRALLDHTPDAWRFFFEFLAQTGLRIGEAIALQWKHVDLGRRHVRVERRWYRGTFASPKSKFGRRRVPLSPASRDGSGRSASDTTRTSSCSRRTPGS